MSRKTLKKARKVRKTRRVRKSRNVRKSYKGGEYEDIQNDTVFKISKEEFNNLQSEFKKILYKLILKYKNDVDESKRYIDDQ